MPKPTAQPVTRASALRALQLDGWVSQRQDQTLLGSLTDVLSDFAPVRRPTVPTQRSARP